MKTKKEYKKRLMDAGLIRLGVWTYPKFRENIMNFDKRHMVKKGKE